MGILAAVSSSFATLSISGNMNWSDAFNSVGQFFLLIIVIVGVLYLAHIATKYFARTSLPKKGKNLDLIDSMSVGQFTAIQVVRAGKKYVLLGVTKERISFLTELNEDELELNDTNDKKLIPFDSYMQKFLPGRLKKSGEQKKQEAENENEDKEQDEDKF